jgi:hypothetical protein
VDPILSEVYLSDRIPEPTPMQIKWLARGLSQTGGKLPLFDENGQRINDRTVRSCLDRGWAELWFENPIKPGWNVCKLTDRGRQLLSHVDLAED